MCGITGIVPEKGERKATIHVMEGCFLDVRQTTLEVGADRPFRALHLSDSHVCLADERENARKLIEELGTEARDLYTPQSAKPVRTDGLKVDRVLEDGDSISLGDMTITAYETKGHTDCSLSYYIEPAGLLLTSESTGILEGKDYVHTPSLKSFSDSLKSCDKCEALHPAYLCLPHFGMLPEDFNETYFRMFRQECASKTAFVREMKDEGLDFAQMLDRYVDRYWTPAKEMEQPKEAFELNSKQILNALLKEIENV